MPKKMPKASDRSSEVASAVLAHFLATGEPATVADVATRLAVAPATVRRWIGKHQLVPGCVWTRTQMDVRERNYGQVVSHRLIYALEPTKHALRAVILGAARD